MRLIVISLLLTVIVQSHAATEPATIAKGPHHRVLQTVREVQTARGLRFETNQITEIQGGLHRWTEERWVEAHPVIEVFQDGAVARNLQYGFVVAPNLATPNALDISLPDGARLQGHLLGLALTEGNQSVLIAEVKDCIGVIGGREQNELTFSDAFTDFNVSVKYVAGRDRLSQVVILHQQLPHPSEWGLTENAVLEVLTEFTAFPELLKEPSPEVNGMARERLSFAAMEFVTGRAFSLGDEANSVVMVKKWELFEGQRSILVEKVPWRAIAPALAQLPAVAKDWRKKDGPLMARAQLPLPKRQQARAAIEPIRIGSVRDTVRSGLAFPGPAYALDWELVSSVNSNLWKGDTTYYISGPITIKTNVFEPGCVIKFAPTNNAKLSVTGPATFLSTNYSPVIMTARDDHSVGEAIGSSPLSGYYADVALDFSTSSSGVSYDIHHLRISHASKAINFYTGRGHSARDVQIVRCSSGISGYYATFDLLNGLFHNVGELFVGVGANSTTGTVQHVTFNSCSNLYPNSATLDLFITNSLFLGVTNIVSFTGAYNGTNGDPSAVLQTVGAGANYLANGSSFRNAGTTNINAGLLNALRQLTTYPPIIAGHLVVLGNADLTLNPQAGRDSDIPDLGWHYSPLDYAFGGTYVTNSTITVNPGTAIAIYSPTNGASSYYGIMLADKAKIFSDGTANNLNRIVRYNTVQEQSQTTWNTTPHVHIASDQGDPPTAPEIRFRFTEWSIPAADAHHFYGYDGTHLIVPFLDCQFWGGKFQTDRPTLNVTNCLFHRTALVLNGFNYELYATFQNNLFYGGSNYLSQEVGGTFTFKNNLFDRVAIAQLATTTHDYNGYITNAPAQWLTNSGTNNVFTTAFTYQTGTLGRFYQPTNSPFLGVGSTNANLLGLYHYTVLTNNVKETDSMVDMGFHYVATDANGVPLDSDDGGGDGLADYIEDADGDGAWDGTETDWTAAHTDNDGVNDYLERLQGRNPLIDGTVTDSGNLINLRIYTPLK